MVTCNICQNRSHKVFRHEVRGKYAVEYFLCDNCGFLQTESPFWIKEAYEDPINLSDTGYVTRNVYLSRRALIILYFLFDRQARFLDYAGGYGILTRLMRDYGLDFLWSDEYTPNLFARGFEFKGEDIEAVTCFECFEHFVDPLTEIKKITAISKNILFSTTLLPDPLPSPEAWDYYGFEHGQHVAFYSKKSLEHLARAHNLNFYTNGLNLHLFTPKPISDILFKTLSLASRFPMGRILRMFLESKMTSDSRRFSVSR